MPTRFQRAPHCPGYRLVLACIAVAGCSQHGLPKYPVAGSVTFDGQPVTDGDILFVPIDVARGPDASRIKDGRFAFEALAGKKRVEIRALRLLPGVPPGPMGVPAAEPYIPARYNQQSQLSVEVIAAGPNEFEFKLVGDKP